MPARVLSILTLSLYLASAANALGGVIGGARAAVSEQTKQTNRAAVETAPAAEPSAPPDVWWVADENCGVPLRERPFPFRADDALHDSPPPTGDSTAESIGPTVSANPGTRGHLGGGVVADRHDGGHGDRDVAVSWLPSSLSGRLLSVAPLARTTGNRNRTMLDVSALADLHASGGSPGTA